MIKYNVCLVQYFIVFLNDKEWKNPIEIEESISYSEGSKV